MIIKHSVDGRFTIDLDSDDIEIVGLMLKDEPRIEVIRKLKASGKSLTESVALVREAEGASEEHKTK